MKDDCEKPENTTRYRTNRKEWRNRRILLYNTLLLLASGAEGDPWESWYNGSTKLVQTTKFDSKLVPGSIYTFLLDQYIHEDEEIMFKFYHDKSGSVKAHSWRGHAFWLVESIKTYRRHLTEHVADAFKGWVDVRKEEGDEKKKEIEFQNMLLDSAKQKFKEKVETLGRDWSKRSWRNRARLYWLLGIVKNTPIFNGKLGKFKSYEYVGPIGKLVHKMIYEDTDMLSELTTEDSFFHYQKAKYDKEKKDKLLLGHLKICRLLTWASATNDPDLVEGVLQHNVECMKSDPDLDYGWEKSWKESWAMALWNASFRGNAEVVMKLLGCNFPYQEVYLKYFSSNSEETLNGGTIGGNVRTPLPSVAPNGVAAGENVGIIPVGGAPLNGGGVSENVGTAPDVALLSGGPVPSGGAAGENKGTPSGVAPENAKSPEKVEPPLHVAVRRRHIAVVHAFCTAASLHFSCHEENAYKETPLEVATKLKCDTANELAIKRKIQSILLQKQEVKDAVEESSKQREFTVNSANAIVVGAVLVAGITFAGWLQPPLGYNSYYQFVEPVPAPPDSYESYMSIQGHRTIQVFAIFNSLSFFSAIAAVIAGLETTCFIEAIEDIYLTNRVTRLRSKLKWTTSLFIISVIFVLIAFSSAGMAILPPIDEYKRSMYITIAIGGFGCVFFICKMLLFSISKRVNNWTYGKIDDFSKSWIFRSNVHQ